MDTSIEYGCMCKMAKEIQMKWKPKWGDFISGIEDDSEINVLMSVRFKEQFKCIDNYNKSDIVWIPRQDQLQEMVREEFENDFSLTMRFAKFIPGHTESTMEKLWLMFVMISKYGKLWFSTERQWISTNWDN